MKLQLDQKAITVVAVSLAIILAAIAAIVVSANRADEAKSYAEAEAAQADIEAAQAKKDRAAADVEREKRQRAEADAQAKKDELEKQRLAKETAEIEAKAAADKRVTAEKNAAAEQARSDAARALREAVVASNQTVRAELDRAAKQATAEQAKADSEAAKLAKEKLKAERIIAEAEVLKHRQSDYEALERNLLEWKLELEERERALKPEKTIADLAWAGGMEDTIIDDKGNVRKQVKTVYDPEKDMELPEQSRHLARAERKVRESQDAAGSETRAAILKSMEKLYVDALKENRVIDADFYKKSILVMYPDWKFEAP